MDGDFDFVSYDLDKMFGLLLKSNPTALEWLRADIVYLNEFPDWAVFQKEVIANLDFKTMFHHYVSLAKGHINLMETGKKFTYKTAFYGIRGLLSADLASQQIIPELLIDNLFGQFEEENEVLKIAKESLERKKQQTEKEEVLEKDKQKILTAIKDFIEKLSTKTLNKPENRQKLESVLTEYSFHLKSKFYGI